MRAWKRDANEKDLVKALRKVGATIDYVDKKPYDLVVGYRNNTYLLETKTEDGVLTENQRIFQRDWRGHYAIARTADEALIAINAIGPNRRSLSQNAYLWGVVYPSIMAAGGETLGGWTCDDLHEYCLGEHFGWETICGFGKRRLKPLRRSSKLSVSEFMLFLEFIQRRMAEHGIHIPDPIERVA